MTDDAEGELLPDSEVARGYDEIAEQIFETSSLYRDTLDLVPDVRGRVLDIGCGQGRLLELLQGRPGITELHGCDISPRMCEMTRERVPSAVVAVESGEHLASYPDARFDVAYMLCSLSNMQRHAEAVAAAARVLVPGGRLAVVVPNREWWLYDRWARHHTALQPVDDHFFRIDEIEGLLTGAGFDPGRPHGAWALWRDGGIHRVELALARLVRPMHRHMKCIAYCAVKRPERTT